MAIRLLMLKRLGPDPFQPVNWHQSSPWMRIPARIMAHLISPKWLLSTETPLESFRWLWSEMVKKDTAFLDQSRSYRDC